MKVAIIGDKPYIDSFLSYYGGFIDGEGHIGIKKMQLREDLYIVLKGLH